MYNNYKKTPSINQTNEKQHKYFQTDGVL